MAKATPPVVALATTGSLTNYREYGREHRVWACSAVRENQLSRGDVVRTSLYDRDSPGDRETHYFRIVSTDALAVDWPDTHHPSLLGTVESRVAFRVQWCDAEFAGGGAAKKRGVFHGAARSAPKRGGASTVARAMGTTAPRSQTALERYAASATAAAASSFDAEPRGGSLAVSEE